jgi:serine/threonine-protein kinase RsbW
MEAERTLRLRNVLSELTRLRSETEELLAAHGTDPDTAYEVNVALEEIVSNVIRHAHEDGAEHELEVALGVSDGELVARVTDDGMPFDPRSAPAPDLLAPMAERPVGGLGIHLVRSLVDGFDYRREGDRNVVVLRKALRPAP